MSIDNKLSKIKKSRIQLVIEDLESQGKITHISYKKSRKIINAISKIAMKAKEESDKKQLASWAYINALESGILNICKPEPKIIYKKVSLYDQVVKYVSNLFK